MSCLKVGSGFVGDVSMNTASLASKIPGLAPKLVLDGNGEETNLAHRRGRRFGSSARGRNEGLAQRYPCSCSTLNPPNDCDDVS